MKIFYKYAVTPQLSASPLTIRLFLILFAVTPATVFGQATDPESDWVTRSTGPDVVRAIGFDSAADVTNNIHPDRGAGNISFDQSVKASGNGAMRFVVPSNSGETSGSGSWRINFSEAPFNIQFGENEEFFVQWRQRFDQYYLEHTYLGGGGWKQIIISQGDVTDVEANACTELEIVVNNGKNWKLPQAYHSCGAYIPYHGHDGSDYLLQNAAGCRWRDGNPDPYDGSCVPYRPDEFMTFQIRLKLGPWQEGIADPLNSGQVSSGFYPSEFEMWVARDGEASRATHRFTNILIRRGNYGDDPRDASHGAEYGKVWFTTYNTGKDASETHEAANTWYDELIISKSKIPDPMATPTPDPEPPGSNSSTFTEGEWFVAEDMPSPGRAGSNAAAYSGFAFDTIRGQIIKRGGGHCDYKGTEVQEFDATGSLTWQIAKPSVPDTEMLPAAHFDDATFPGAVVVLADGSAPTDFAAAVANGQAAPIARHTTNSTTFIESTGEFFMTGKYTYSQGTLGCTTGVQLPYRWGPADAWAYDPTNKRWRYLARHSIDMEWAGCAWSSAGQGVSDAQGAVFCITEQDKVLHRYDVAKDSWTVVNQSVPEVGLGINLTYSKRFHTLYYFRNGSLFGYDIGGATWSPVTATGSVSADNLSATAYDSINDVVGVWDAYNLFFCDLSSRYSCSWSVATRNDMPRFSGGGGFSSNFAYDSANNVFWAANAAGTNIALGAYRFKTGSPPVPPLPPSRLEIN